MAQIAGNAHWAESSSLFAHRAHPNPLNCKNEYLMLALWEETTTQAVVYSSRLYRLGVAQARKAKVSGDERLAATRFIFYAPNFPFFP